MAFIHLNFFSSALQANTDVNICIPTPNSDELMNDKDTSYFKDDHMFQVLYLLHGAFGDYSDWARLTSIERYAQEYKIAVVMPSAANSFYTNMRYGVNYLTYLTDELPAFLNSLFPFSSRREDNFTAGLSMGGYGAWKVALTKPSHYAACASLSGALDIDAVRTQAKQGEINGPFNWNAINGDEPFAGSPDDLFALIQNHKAQNIQLPELFMSCGKEDFIYPVNELADERLRKLDVKYTYERHSGVHDWEYWDTHIQRVLEWLPLARTSVKIKP